MRQPWAPHFRRFARIATAIASRLASRNSGEMNLESPPVFCRFPSPGVRMVPAVSMSQKVLSSWAVCNLPRWDKSEILGDLEGEEREQQAATGYAARIATLLQQRVPMVCEAQKMIAGLRPQHEMSATYPDCFRSVN